MSTTKFNFKGKEFKFSFNSFQYMDELDFSALEDKNVRKKPLKVATTLQLLVMGATNAHSKIKVSEDEVVEYLDDFVSNGGDINELLTFLIEKLQESSFFKSLQKAE